MNNPLLKLAQRTGYTYQDESLVLLALTHRSKGDRNNERLEFLGDSILNFVIAEKVFQHFPQAKEGKLSRLRSRIVKEETLAQVAKGFDLGEFLILGSGELKSGGFRRESILADTIEALIGAMYLDAGMDVTRERILAWFSPYLDNLTLDDPVKDPKTRLQEYQQAQKLSLPLYAVIQITGPSNEQIFTVRCTVPQSSKAPTAQGNSRRHAEQEAALQMLKILGLEQ